MQDRNWSLGKRKITTTALEFQKSALLRGHFSYPFWRMKGTVSLKEQSNCSYRDANLPNNRQRWQKGSLNFHKTWPVIIWLVSAAWRLKARKVAEPQQKYLKSLHGRKIARRVFGRGRTQGLQFSVTNHPRKGSATKCWRFVRLFVFEECPFQSAAAREHYP